RHGAAAGAPALCALQAAGPSPGHAAARVRPRPRGLPRPGLLRARRLRRVRGHRLPGTDRIRQLILERRPTGEIKQVAREEGMTFLRDSALEKVFAGFTTLREINKVTFVA